MKSTAFAILMTTLLSGAACTPTPIPPPAPSQPPAMSDGSRSPKMLGQAALASTNVDGTQQLQADVYKLVVPIGSISRNEGFWKRVDEQVLDVATYDLLYKNGVRVGVAPIAEWDRFKALIAEQPSSTQAITLVGAESKPVQLPMRKEVAGQEIFYFNSSNQLEGRSYDQSENLVTLSLQTAPRKPGTMRVALCPVVRATRKRLEYASTNKELGEVTYVTPEHLYDMNLRADVPPDDFLIIAPSPQATWPTSIGNTFFVSDGPAEQMENVLLIVPRLVKVMPKDSKP